MSDVRAEIEEVFGRGHIMLQIADCESNLRQFKADGSVLMGGGGGNYIGVFQIGKQWVSRAKDMGMDVYTLEGNVAFAKWLYTEEIEIRGQPLWKQWECALYI